MIELTDQLHYQTTLASGKHWSLRLRRGLLLSINTEDVNSNLGMVFYNSHNLLERYNAPDTLKCQHTFHLTQGHCLYSDMGRIMASIVHDTTGGHETICGNSHAGQVAEQFGQRSYQSDRNNWYQNGHDAFLVELAKYGLDRNDLPANINWFNRCQIRSNGDIELAGIDAELSQNTTLRIEMDCLVLMHSCPHPMLKTDHYPQSTIRLAIADAPPMTDDDECLNQCDENRRGYENNRLYHLGSP